MFIQLENKLITKGGFANHRQSVELAEWIKPVLIKKPIVTEKSAVTKPNQETQQSPEALLAEWEDYTPCLLFFRALGEAQSQKRSTFCSRFL